MLDRRKIGLGVMVFIRVSIDSHSEAEARKFEREVIELEDVVACYSIGEMPTFFCRSSPAIWIPMPIFPCR